MRHSAATQSRPDTPPVSRPPMELSAELIAVLVAVTDDEPRVLTLHQAALPSGPFAATDRSLQASLRAWVERQTGHPLGYVEQLYTFADRDRTGEAGHPSAGPIIGISYLGLTRETRVSDGYEASWQGWYRYFPWEDQRAGPGVAREELASQPRHPDGRSRRRGQAELPAPDPARARRLGRAYGGGPAA